jgi:hypothetical protein
VTFAVTIHLASGQSVRSDIIDETEVFNEEAVLAAIKDTLSGAPRWCEVAGILVYSQVVSAIEIETIGGSQ